MIRCAAIAVLIGWAMAAHADVGAPVAPGRDTPTLAPDDNAELLACGTPPDDDPATLPGRAAEHYQKADDLEAEGEYGLAIPEYKASYCLVNNPAPIKAIAQAYERLVDYETAVRWHELYIEKLPATQQAERDRTAHRIAILQRLPAHVQISTEPTGATIVLEPLDGQARVEGIANRKEPLTVHAGHYTIHMSADGYEDYTADLVAKIGQPYSFTATLARKTGRLRVTTDPTGARIFVDKKLVAVGGTYVDLLPIGMHTIVAEAVGYGSKSEDTFVTPDAPANVTLTLARPAKSGRFELELAAALYGTTFGGTVGTSLFGQGAGGTSLFSLGGGAIGFAGAYLGAPERIPVGHTSWIIGGTLWGALEGFGTTRIFTANTATIGGVSIASSLAAAVATSLTASKLDQSAGDAALINSGGLWGTTAGVMMYALFKQDRLVGPLMLAGLDCGLLAGVAVARKYDYSRGHVALIDLAGLGGAITGVAIANAFPTSVDGSRRVHFALAGIGVGLLAGALLTRHMDEAAAPTTLASRTTPILSVTGRGTPIIGFALPW